MSASASSSKIPQDPVRTADDEEEAEEDERLDLAAIQGFADKIQRRPVDDEDGGPRIKIVIPKRGEKDFEPLAETVNLQEMMLQRSREALFGALAGVRGGNSKATSHAIMTPDSIYPKMLVVRGHLLDTMGISVRYHKLFGDNARTYIELLPEEALYLLERGTLQIWLGKLPQTTHEAEQGVGEWCEEEYGVRGAVEMSVMEGFATFVGAEGLTWERYQAYAYLKRLGYTVQRSRRFLPDHFTATDRKTAVAIAPLPPFKTWWTSLPLWISRLVQLLGVLSRRTVHVAAHACTRVLGTRGVLSGAGLTSYASILEHLRFIPTSHSQSLPKTAPTEAYTTACTTAYTPLQANPYLPFWHVWKPATHWSKASWDRGSQQGFAKQKPEYIVAVVNARDTPMPSLAQLSQVFDDLPDEPQGPVPKLGPQYERQPRAGTRSTGVTTATNDWNPLRWLLTWRQNDHPPPRNTNPMAALRNGDRGLIVAVNDSGNAGWLRFGRSGFAEHAVI